MSDIPLFKSTPNSTVVYQEAATAVNKHLDAIEYDGAEATLASPPLTSDEAKEITESIKSASETLYVLIYRAHAGKAWEALGYQTFEDYVREEFDISRSRAYRLLSQASVIKEIEAAAPPGSVIRLKEKDAYQLRNMLDQILPEVEKLAQQSSEDADTNFMIEEILREAKEKSEQTDRDEREKTNSQPHVYSGLEKTESEMADEYSEETEDPSPILRSPKASSSDDDDYSYIDDDFIADIMSSSPVRAEPKRSFPEGHTTETTPSDNEESEISEEPEELSIGDEKNFEYSYALMTAVSNLKGLPSPGELVKVIPVNNLEKMKEMVPGVIEWLTAFQAKIEEATSESEE